MARMTEYNKAEEEQLAKELERYQKLGKRTKIILYDHGVHDYFVEIDGIPGAYASIRTFEPFKLPERLERLVKEREERERGLWGRLRRLIK